MLTWFLFLVGQACYVAAQLEAIVRAHNNTAESRWQILKDRRVAFLIRGIAGSMIFWIFLGGGLPDLLTSFGVETPGWLLALSAVINSQAGPPCAWFAGLGVDSLLGFIPFLKSYIPTVVVTVSSKEETKVDPKTGAIETTEQTTTVTKTPPLTGTGDGTKQP